jgi:UDP-N-acetylglucosamine--N-acetylmuramyl-(pentapeptide) pyrophosphoryl-undecaprenol N-acetylglucosamine transferase
MPHSRLSIIFTGGGTGGHLFAGLAAAEALRQMEPLPRIVFAGCGNEWERHEVKRSGYDYAAVPCCPWPCRAHQSGRFLATNFRGFLAGRRLLHRYRASAVVGLGGYVSAPVARAAVGLRVPLVLLEQNAVPGRVTRWLSRQAACVCTSFESTTLAYCKKVRHTGNPIRRSLLENLRTAEREKLLVVTGGSLGAGALNAAVPDALRRIRSLLIGWRIIHQTGSRDLIATRERYRELPLPAEVMEFADLVSLLPRAGLVISRAGGSTLSELAVAGVPALVCPYPGASENHQRKNAAAFADACRVIDQEPPDFVGRMARELAELTTDTALRQELSRGISHRARPDAAQRVADAIRQTAAGLAPLASRQ